MDLGYFESLGDALKMSTSRERRFWADVRKTGYQQLDEGIGGLRPNELYIFASQHDWLLPGLFLQLIENVAIREGRPVLHIRIGADLRSLVGSWLKRTGSDPAWCKDRHNLDEINQELVAEHINAPIYVFDAHGYSCEKIMAAIESCAKSIKAIGLIVIDGIDRLDIWTRISGNSIAERWASVSSELKNLALTHQCPVVVDSRIKRIEPDGTVIELPGIGDLPHGSAIATSADYVFVLEAVAGVFGGEPSDLYPVYSRTGLFCRRIPFRYEYDRCRWVEIAADH